MYFEDIKIGDKVELAPVTVDKEEMVAFAKRYNPVPFHTDEEFAKKTKAGALTSSGLYTFALMWAEYVTQDIGGEQTIAGLSMRLDFKAPVFAGDVLRGTAEVISKHERNPYNGVFTVRIDIFNSSGELVLTNETDTVVKRKPTEEGKE
ncbi:MAG: hypothetical protein J6O40_06675 [Ruminococcus sp.]|nr:hypothetical protein [Ruminococcus sp.]